MPSLIVSILQSDIKPKTCLLCRCRLRLRFFTSVKLKKQHSVQQETSPPHVRPTYCGPVSFFYPSLTRLTVVKGVNSCSNLYHAWLSSNWLCHKRKRLGYGVPPQLIWLHGQKAVLMMNHVAIATFRVPTTPPPSTLHYPPSSTRW